MVLWNLDLWKFNIVVTTVGSWRSIFPGLLDYRAG